MFMNSVNQRANAFAFSNRLLNEESHRLSRASGQSQIAHCTLKRVLIDCVKNANSDAVLAISHSVLHDSTLQTTGSLILEQSQLSGGRLSAAELLRLQRSHLRHCFIRLQPGSGLIINDNDIDGLNIDGTDSFSHTFTLKGLFTGSRFKGLLVADGQLQAIFYRSLWRDCLLRDTQLSHTLFNRCVLDDVRFRHCRFTGSTFSHCQIGAQPLTFEQCDLRGCRFIRIHPYQCRFIRCTGISAASFSL